MVRYPFSSVVNLDQRIVRAEHPTAKLKSSGAMYYIQDTDGSIIGSHSPTPEWAWRTAAKHVRCM